jgi:hypothetical protein
LRAQYLKLTIFEGQPPLKLKNIPKKLRFLQWSAKNDHIFLFYRTCDIGVWYNVLWCMVAVSMLTNTVIMGFSSEQLAEWLPWMYETIAGDQYIKLGYGR